MPHPRAFYRRLTEQDRFKTIRYKYQMVYFKLKLDKGTSYLHLKQSLSFYCPFLVSHWVTNAISYLLNHLNGQIPQLPRLGVKFPTPCSSSEVKFPIPGEREGVKCPWYARGEGMLRLQIDRCIITDKYFFNLQHTHIPSCVGFPVSTETAATQVRIRAQLSKSSSIALFLCSSGFVRIWFQTTRRFKPRGLAEHNDVTTWLQCFLIWTQSYPRWRISWPKRVCFCLFFNHYQQTRKMSCVFALQGPRALF